MCLTEPMVYLKWWSISHIYRYNTVSYNYVRKKPLVMSFQKHFIPETSLPLTWWQWQWQWNNLYCQVTYKSCTESYDENKTSNRTIIHEIYRTWQRGREAIMAYVPQYQLYQRDCVFGVQSRNNAECWNSFNLMLFLSCTCMSYVYLKKNTCTYIYTCTHLYTNLTWLPLMH